jgi:uncharacterized protein (TIGR03067 family)
MRFCLWLAALVVAVSANRPGVSAEEPATELEGTWKASYLEEGGREVPRKTYEVKFVIHNGTLELSGRRDFLPFEGEGTLVLDTHKKAKEITIRFVTPFGDPLGKPVPGIYELTDDALKVCLDMSGKKRPEAYKSGSSSDIVVLVLKKDKASKR